VLASGHPQADIFLLKHAPSPAEVHEGVAFYGRSGEALLKSFRRLEIDPLVVYGTVAVKCPVEPRLSAPECRARVRTELAIVGPRIVVVMGEPALEVLNELELPLGRTVEPRLGEVQPLTPTCDALLVPDIDAALDNEEAKREFWASFRELGEWYRGLPPY
jgi:uracil-DNA glycosylase family 4